jgi:iron complex outermembrane receptor protein
MNFSSFFRIAAFSVAMFGMLSPMIAQQKSDAKSKTPKDSVRVFVVPSVTVTTTRAKESVSPIPFSEISRADIKEQHTVTDIPVLLSDMPSSFFYSENGNGVGYSYLRIRGFDQRRIAVMINGIPQNDPEDHNMYWIDVPDAAANMQSIQVQRGAGLMNYGSPAIGGSISLSSANFADSRFVRFSSGIGYQQYSSDEKTVFAPITSKFSAEISSGLVDKYAVYARLSRINSNGYRNLSWAELNSYFFSAARFDENVTTQINIFGGPLSDGLAYNGLPKSYISDLKLRRLNYNDFGYDSTGKTVEYSVDRRPQEVEGFSQPHYEILNDIFLTENLTLKSSLFYYTGAGYFDYDAYWADAATLRLTPDYGFPAGVNPTNSIIRATVENKQGGWIPRLVWQHLGGELTVGAEVRQHKSYHYGKIQFAEGLPTGFNPDFTIYEYNGYRQILSAFAREQYQVSDATLLTVEGQVVSNGYTIGNEKGGGKYSEYRTINGGTISGNGDIFTVNYLFFNPRVGITHALDDANTVYASAAITSREPRMKNLYAAEDAFSSTRISPLFESDTTGGVKKYDFSKPLVKPEQMIDIEAGIRSRSKDGQTSVALNLYWMEFANELVKSGRIDIFGNPIDGNAPRSRHIGIEAEVMKTLWSSGDMGTLTLSGNITVSRNRFVEYNYFQKRANQAISLADLPIAGFPDILANLRLSYRVGGLWTSIIMKGVGGFYSDNFGDKLKDLRKQFPSLTSYSDNRVEPYSVVNLDISYEWNSILSLQSVRLHGHCTNLLNTLYAANAEGKDFYPAAERGFYFGIDLGL